VNSNHPRDLRDKTRRRVQTDSLRGRFERFAQKTSMVWIAVFWLGLMGVLFIAMTHYTNQRKTIVEANGVMTIKKDPDGHFYAPGALNGQAVIFLVDTGATLISITDDVARLARLPAGEPAQFQTAGGTRAGTIVSGITVQVGSFRVSNMRVGTGLEMSDTKKALLGQNFLSKFHTQIEGNTLTLKPLPR
jgi:aspartyl protease family protein